MSWFKKDPLQIIAFQSYGTASHFHIRGRALEDEVIDLSKKSYFSLLVNSWKRFETDEIKHAPLNVKLPNGKILKVVSDSHGYYRIDESIEDLDAMTDTEGWLNYEVSYENVNLKRKIQQGNRFVGELLIPSKNSSFGVISDIDDTILHTGVVSSLKWQVIYNTIFRPAKKRIPLEGAAEFYHKLHRGVSGKEANPVFYVSHSPWNLYRYLEFFLNENSFPKGPILLRSFKDILRKKAPNEKPIKQQEIINVLETYPYMSFILIGDSGEKDPDIYLELADAYPKQVKAIYLRSVKSEKRITRVSELLKRSKIPSLLVNNSEEAMRHARAHGFLK